MRARITIILLLAFAAFGPADAGKNKGKQVRFVGGHPIPKGEGGGFCHIEAPHVHIYAPTDVKLQYRVHDGDYFFIGDPVAYGWEGEKYSYYGHHPVAVDVVVGDDDHDEEYCYLDGPHYHAYAPPATLSFELKADAYWYIGEPAPAYLEARPVLDPIDVVYEPIVYTRPAVVVTAAPVGWIGVVVAAPVVEIVTPRPKHVHAEVGVEVVAPSLEIEVGLPTVVIGGGVIVHEHRHDRGKHKGWKKHRGRGHW